MPHNMHRRGFLEMMGAAAALPMASGAARAANGKRPNVIVVFADDLGYGDVSGFGYAKSPFETPHLERMAAEGAKLTHFFVPMPFCAPSRASLLTGRYPFRNGVVHNPAPDAGIHDVGLPLSEITIADLLQQAGYATSCIGKWHLGHRPEYLPRRRGFDEYYGILYSNDMRPVQIVENESVAEYPAFQPTLTKRYTERALDFIERNFQRNKPFFLYLPHAMPHKPLAASEEFHTPDTPDDLYADVIRELDGSVGRILDKLRELGIEENTLVFFTSDNGPWYGGSTGGLRGMKGLTWEGGLRVPMIAWQPGTIPAGVENSSVAASIDLFPTILKAAGVEPPEGRVIDGRDIWPLLTSSDAESPHEAVFGMRGPQLRTLRSGPWRLHVLNPGSPPNRDDSWIDPRGPDGVTIVAQFEQSRPSEYPGSLGGDPPSNMMLFNVAEDPAEQRDVSGEHPDVVKRLKAIFDKTAAEVPEFEPPNRYPSMRNLTGGSMDIEDWER